MAQRFMMFIDGANLQGVLNTMELKSPSYGSLISHLFQRSVEHWKASFDRTEEIIIGARFIRAYYYGVGTIDECDLSDPKSISALRELFEKNLKVLQFWMAAARKKTLKEYTNSDEEVAWSLFLEDTRGWYSSKVASHDATRNFLYGVESKTDLFEVNRDGHTKLNLVAHTAHEKCVDTGLSVAMAEMVDHYDIAILVTGDFDAVPAVKYVKRKGKQVGLIDIYQEALNARRGPSLSKDLQREVDFVTSVSDQDLLEADIVIAKPKISSR